MHISLGSSLLARLYSPHSRDAKTTPMTASGEHAPHFHLLRTSARCTFGDAWRKAERWLNNRRKPARTKSSDSLTTVSGIGWKFTIKRRVNKDWNIRFHKLINCLLFAWHFGMDVTVVDLQTPTLIRPRVRLEVGWAELTRHNTQGKKGWR